MALNDSQFSDIQTAYGLLGIELNSRDELASKTTETVDELVSMINAMGQSAIEAAPTAEEKEQLQAELITYERGSGYSLEVAQRIEEKLEALKSNPVYLTMKGIAVVNKDEVANQLSQIDGMPEALAQDPQKLFNLIDASAETFDALEAAHEEGLLTVSVLEAVEEAPVETVVDEETETPTEEALVETAVEEEAETPTEGAEVTEGAETEESDAEVETSDADEDALPTPEEASLGVETVLNIITPQVNRGVEEKAEEYGELAQIFAADLVNSRLPENLNIGGPVDLKSQAALQGLMMFVSHSMVLDMGSHFPDSPSWDFTKEKGQFMIDNSDLLYEKIGGNIDMSKEQFKATLEGFVTSLNVLEDNDILVDFAVFFGRGVDVPGYTIDLVQEELERHKDLDGAKDLFNELTRAYVGMGLDQLMGDEAAEFSPEPSDFQTRLRVFYEQALRAKDGNAEQLDTELLIMLNTITSLPFGHEGHADVFVNGVRQAILTGDADEFLAGVLAVQDQLNEMGPASYEHYFMRDPTVHPKLKNSDLTFASDGESFAINDVIVAYNNYKHGNLNAVGGKLAFTANDKQYVTAVDAYSNIFSIEEVDVGKLNKIFFTQEKLEEILPEYVGQDMDLEERIEIFNTLLYERANEPFGDGSQSYYRAVFNNEAVERAMKEDAGFSMMFQSDGDDPNNVFKLYPDYSSFMWDINKGFEGLKPQIEQLEASATRQKEEAVTPGFINGIPMTTPAGPPQTPTRGEVDPNSKPYTVEDLKRDMVSDQKLIDLAASMVAGPQLLSADDVAFLNKHDGELLNLGRGGYLMMAVRSVDASGVKDPDAPIIGYYDYKRDIIKQINLPEAFMDPEKWDVLEAQLDPRNMDQDSYMKYIQGSFPGLYELALNYRTNPYGRNLEDYMGQPVAMQHENFVNDLRSVAINLQQSMRENGYSPTTSQTDADARSESKKSIFGPEHTRRPFIWYPDDDRGDDKDGDTKDQSKDDRGLLGKIFRRKHDASEREPAPIIYKDPRLEASKTEINKIAEIRDEGEQLTRSGSDIPDDTDRAPTPTSPGSSRTS